MDKHMSVYRDEKTMTEGLEKVRDLKKRFENISIADKGRIYNSNLINALETENLLTLAEIMTMAAIARKESRGGHARRDFPKRDDENFLKHTLVTKSDEGPHISYKPVIQNKWKPIERKY